MAPKYYQFNMLIDIEMKSTVYVYFHGSAQQRNQRNIYLVFNEYIQFDATTCISIALLYFPNCCKLTGHRGVTSLHELGLKTDDFNPIIDKWFHLLCIA